VARFFMAQGVDI